VITLEEVRQRLIDAMALPERDHEGWLEIAEHKLYAERARAQPFKRMYDVSTVGMRLRTAREAVGLSVVQCAIRARMCRRALSAIELGRKNLPVAKLGTLCRVLGVREKWILEGGDEGAPAVPTEQLRKRVTQRWRERQDLLAARRKARAEAERLNRFAAKLRAEGARKPTGS
jgi:transcriptional regulator with XRE-family HTH domain